MGKHRLSPNEKTTIIIAVISAIVSIAVAYFAFRGTVAPAEIAIGATQTAESRSLTLTPRVLISPPAAENTSTPTFVVNTPTLTLKDSTPTPTMLPAIQPTVQILSDLSPVQRGAVQAAAAGILQVAGQLPLLVRDNFDTKDYAWNESHQIFDQGIECTTAYKEEKYSILLESTSQVGSWCISAMPRSPSNFFVSVETSLVENRNAEIFVYYRYIDGLNFNYLILHPQMQTILVGIKQDGKDSIFVQSLFIPSIFKDKMNKLALIVTGGSHTIYINDNLEILISNENTLEHGQFHLGLRLNEANETQELLLDNFELRGD